MKYLVRSVKYFLSLLVVLVLVLLVLVKLNLVNSEIEDMFRNGYDSLWQIALILAAFSALYPKIGYGTRDVHAPGSLAEQRAAIVGYMDSRGYKLLKEDDEKLEFVLRSPLSRLFRMFEDNIVVSKTFDGVRVEGLTKDIVRVASAIQSRLENSEQ